MYPDFIVTLGFTQNTLEKLIFFSAIIFILGVVIVLYWKHIVFGVLALSCLVVMANHKSTVKEQPVESVIEKKDGDNNQVKLSEPITPMEGVPTTTNPAQAGTPAVVSPKFEESKDIRKEFMDKCINLADYTRTQCDELWDDRVKEERAILEDTKLKGKQHGHYRKV